MRFSLEWLIALNRDIYYFQNGCRAFKSPVFLFFILKKSPEELLIPEKVNSSLKFFMISIINNKAH